MMSLWDALRMNMMISYQELVRTFHSMMDNEDAPSFQKYILKAQSQYESVQQETS
ncbi:YdjO [Klebsiella michiganensis]